MTTAPRFFRPPPAPAPVSARQPPAAFTRLVLLALASGAGAFFLSGCAALESGADALADATAGSAVSNVFRGAARGFESFKDYSPSQEHFIGRAVAAEILSRYKVNDDPRLTEYVNLVGLAVVYGAPEVHQTFSGYHFTVLEGEELNAISAPGGFIFLTLGTVKRARNEDELAAVLAHEIAHVSLRHGIEAIQKATRKRSGALLVQGVGETAAEVSRAGGGNEGQLVELTGLFAGAIQDITSELLVKGYSRKSEAAADELGAKFLAQASYARSALASYLGRLDAEGGKGGWFGTHPPARERVEALGAAIRQDPPAVLAGLPTRQRRFRAAVGA